MRRTRSVSFRLVVPAPLLLGVVAGLTACGPLSSPDAPAPAATAARPSVLILVVDALRADRVGAYGYARDTTPTLDRLAADPDAVLFRRHYVQGTWTKTSTASLFTGLFPFQHGTMEGHVPARNGDGRFFTTQALDGGFETLAERLKGAGFSTFGITKSRHLLPQFGFGQGFDTYLGPHEIPTERGRVEETLDLAARLPGPFFGYLHLAGPHHPYPAEMRDETIMRGQDFPYDEDARIAAGVDFRTAEIKHRINREGLRLTPEDAKFLSLVYDARTRKVDANYVAELVEGLKRLGVYDNLLLVVTADHGEELYDHAGYSHGHALWDEVIHVPLIVKFPRGRRPAGLAARVESLTRSIDLSPSILAFAGHPVPPELPGEDVFDGSGPRFALAERTEEWALVEGGDKLIEAKDGPRLYDLARDPGETRNLAAGKAARVTAMRLIVESVRRSAAVQPRDADWIDTELDAEDVEALKGLGYLR